MFEFERDAVVFAVVVVPPLIRGLLGLGMGVGIQSRGCGVPDDEPEGAGGEAGRVVVKAD